MNKPVARENTSAPSRVPLIDMQRQYAPLEQELLDAIGKVCASGRFVLGPDVEQLEASLAAYCQASYAIGCASGSDALLLALMAYDIGPGDEVICPSYSFFATASAVARLGAKPVFVDIQSTTMNIDPELTEAAVTSATKAIIPVHLFGQTAAMESLKEIGRRHGLPIIEDAAQAIGAEYAGRRAGAIGEVGCFSFYPTKNLGCFGDGGLLTTNDQGLAERLKLLRGHGMQPRYYHRVLGINSRLDSIQAAILNVKLPHLEQWTELRGQHAARYSALIDTYKLADVLQPPRASQHGRHVWNQYVVRVAGGQRDQLRAHLADAGVASEVYYPVAIHQQQCFAYLGYRAGSLPVTERATQETLALPMFPELTAAEQERVVSQMAVYFGRARKAA